jgi:dolichol-phosphate mannosyltransferase
MNSKKISVGIPVRNEEENLKALEKEIEKLSQYCAQLEIDLELLVNDNASTDASYKMLMEWATKEPRLDLKRLKIPLSYQASIQNMMKRATGDAFIVFQSDLQDPREIAEIFIQSWLDGNEIVAGVVKSRKEKVLSKFTRHSFYKLLKVFSDGNFIVGFQDFYLISNLVYKELAELPIEGLFLRGHISSRFGKVLEIQYERNKRKHGISNFNFSTKYSLALDGILLFGTRFIRTISTVSFLTFFASVIIELAIFVFYILGFHPPIKGWSSLAIILLISISILGMTTGLILEYLIRIYRRLILNS